MRRASLATLSFLAALVLSGVGDCNLHEMGHLVTGWAMGVPVNDVIWCTPGNGRIVFAYQEPAIVGFAGGLLAALALGAVYWGLIRPRLDSLYWWTAGVAVAGTAISQLIVAVLEGSSPQGYAKLQGNTAGLLLLFVVPLVAVAGFQYRAHRPHRPVNRSETIDSP